MKTRNFSQKPFISQKTVPIVGITLLMLWMTTQILAQSSTCTLTLHAEVSNVQCVPNDSSDESDDTFTFTLVVTGGNPWGWSGGGLAMGDYGTAYTFGPYLISGGTVSFTIVDMDNPTCTVDVNVSPPAPCSPGSLVGSIGDYVWNDTNSNGIQEAGESGLSGVYVILYDAGMNVLDSKITDADGAYSFTEVIPATYKIKFANPGGFEASLQDASANDDNDSDQDFLGFTDFFTLGNGENRTNIDAGFQPISQPTCDIMVNVTNVDCRDDGTFTFTAIITGGNPWGWSGGGIAMGNYGEPTVFGPFSINGGTVTITIVDMDNPTCTETFSVEPCDTPPSGPCVNVTDAGEIGHDESRCGPYDPEPIISVAPATGGTGDLEYMWLQSTEACPGGDFKFIIPGANEATYDPGLILQTTWFRRCARRAGCPWDIAGETECVVKTVTSDCPSGSCETRMVSNASSCTNEVEFGISTRDFITGTAHQSDLYYVHDAQMIEQHNGHARMIARFINTENTNIAFEIHLTFTGRTKQGSPTLSDCYQIDDNDWHYYTGVNGTWTGLRALSGGQIHLSSSGHFQLGTGANLHDFSHYGASVDFDLTLLSQPSTSLWLNTGEDAELSLHLRLSGDVPACTDVQGWTEGTNNRFTTENLAVFAKDFRVFPNPASQVIRLDLRDYQSEEVEVSIVNHLGQQVKTRNFSELIDLYYQLNVGDLASGLYFVHVQTAGQLSSVKRLMVVK